MQTGFNISYTHIPTYTLCWASACIILPALSVSLTLSVMMSPEHGELQSEIEESYRSDPKYSYTEPKF